MKRISTVLFAMAMLLACQKSEVTEQLSTLQYEPLTISVEQGDSRIHLSDNRAVWNNGDMLSVFYKSKANQMWQYVGEAGAKSGKIEALFAPSSSEALPYIVALYPYNSDYTIDSNCAINYTLPIEQQYNSNCYNNGSAIMVAASESTDLELKQSCGWLELQICSEEKGVKVQKITLKGNNNEKVAGKITIDPLTATAKYSSATSKRKVSLICSGSGVSLSQTPTSLHIALAPQRFAKGFTIEITTADGRTMTKSTTKEVSIERNTILPMEPFTIEPKIVEQVITPTTEPAASSDMVYGLRYEPGISINIATSKFESQLSAISKAGFKYIEICIAHSAGMMDMSDTEALEFLAAKLAIVKKYNLTVWSIHLPYEDKNWTSVSSTDETIRTQSVENISRVLTFCAQTFTDCKNYVLHASKSVSPSTAALNQAHKSLEQMDVIARQYGVRLCVENLVGSYCYTLSDLLNVVKPFSNVYVTYDIGHANCKGYNVVDYLASIGTKLGTVHIHDTVYGSGVDDHRIVGYGDIGTNFGWGNVYKTMLTTNRYRGVFLFELSGEDPTEVMATYNAIVEDYKKRYEY